MDIHITLDYIGIYIILAVFTVFLLSLVGTYLYIDEKYHLYFRRCPAGTPCRYCDEVRVLFFPDRKPLCHAYMRRLLPYRTDLIKVCQNRRCEFLHNRPKESRSSLAEYIRILASAEKQIDLCMFRSNHRGLSDILRYSKQKKRIRVRIVTDTSRDDNDQISSLRDAGIEVKSMIQTNPDIVSLMHNKFVIVDKKIVIMGSFNWTNNAVTKNDESILIVQRRAVVQDFLDKFDEMWTNSTRYSYLGY